MTMSLIEKARYHADLAHASINYRRKYTNELYFRHCENVAYLVSLVVEEILV
jgi:hypothetical protein